MEKLQGGSTLAITSASSSQCHHLSVISDDECRAQAFLRVLLRPNSLINNVITSLCVAPLEFNCG